MNCHNNLKTNIHKYIVNINLLYIIIKQKTNR